MNHPEVQQSHFHRFNARADVFQRVANLREERGALVKQKQQIEAELNLYSQRAMALKQIEFRKKYKEAESLLQYRQWKAQATARRQELIAQKERIESELNRTKPDVQKLCAEAQRAEEDHRQLQNRRIEKLLWAICEKLEINVKGALQCETWTD